MRQAVKIPKLFHFTSERFVCSIMKEGLTRGKMLADWSDDLKKVKLINGWQWLTTNESFDQSWAVGTGKLPYKRNEVRMTIIVPEGRHRLNPWSQIQFLFPRTAPILNAYGDPESWWLYEGTVKPDWIKELKRKG